MVNTLLQQSQLIRSPWSLKVYQGLYSPHRAKTQLQFPHSEHFHSALRSVGSSITVGEVE
jgi:hypothetical protein